ncbi:MAG: hypothetical protein IKH57_13680 [Clostridia bacterium]|nr:hypothetical protein [Clostridia bacterium]
MSSDEVKAETGSDGKIDAAGDFTHDAVTVGDIQVFTAAMAVAAGAEAGTAVGGAVNVIVTKNQTQSTIGDNTSIEAKGNASVRSDTRLDLIAISGSANVSAGAGSKVAAGGVVNVIVDKATTETNLGGGVKLTQFKNGTVASNVNDRMLVGTASLSVAANVGSGKAMVGVANVIVDSAKTHTTLGEKAEAQGTGNVKITANNDAYLLNAGLSLAGASGMAVGGAFNVNVLNREAIVEMGNGSTVTAGGNAAIQAAGKDTKILAGLSAAGGVTGAAVGVTSLTVVKNNEVMADLGNSTVTATAAGSTIKNKSGEDVEGIYVGANAKETQFVGGAGNNGVVTVMVNNNKVIADASGAVLTSIAEEKAKQRQWTVDTIYIKMDQWAYFSVLSGLKGTTASDGDLSGITGTSYYYLDQNGNYALIGNIDDVTKEVDAAGENGGSVSVKASDDTYQFLLAGGLGVNVGAGEGASMVTLVSNKDVEALGRSISADKDVNVIADNRDKVHGIVASTGASDTSAINFGAAIQVLKSKIIAHADGDVISEAGNFNLAANNTAKLNNVAATVAVSETSSGVPVAAVTYFKSEADARVMEGSSVSAQNTTVSVTADKTIDFYTVGAAVSDAAGVSGAVNIIVAKDIAHAAVANGAKANADNGNVTINADSGYTLRSRSAAVAIPGTEAAGVNATVSVLKGNTTAELEGEATASGGVNVNAIAKRDVISVEAEANGGLVEASAGVIVLVSGTKMSQDAADMLTYGNSTEEEKKAEKTTFDAKTFLDIAKTAGAKTEDFEDELGDDISGNGHHESDQNIGTAGKNKDDKDVGAFDADSAYRSKELDSDRQESLSTQGRGENQTFSKDSEDIDKVKHLNQYTYDEPEDAVIASIAEGAAVKANSVTVTAQQPVAADLIGAVIAAGEADAGISAAMAILHSNVLASSQGDIQTAGGDVTVEASSVSGKFADDSGANQRNETVKNLLKSESGVKEDLYSIGQHLYVLTNVADGAVSLFDGLYQAAFDGDTFDSFFTLVEGISTDNLTVTLKQGQTVRAE